jgi:hypothetical protein
MGGGRLGPRLHQEPYFHIVTNCRQSDVVLYGLLPGCLILLCSSGSARGIRPLLRSLAQAVPAHIQNVSVVLLWVSAPLFYPH